MTNPLQNSNHSFLVHLREKLIKKPYHNRTKLIVCVWHENQIVPAKVYCKNLTELSEILVCENAANQRDKIISDGGKAIVYAF